MRRGRPLKDTAKRIRTSFTLNPDHVAWLHSMSSAQKRSQSDFLDELIGANRERLKHGSPMIRISLPYKSIANLCKRFHIQKLSLFGSVLRNDFSPKSDIDVLVEFMPGQKIGFFDLAQIETELSNALNGRKIDLVTREELSRYFRDEVIQEAETIYAA